MGKTKKSGTKKKTNSKSPNSKLPAQPKQLALIPEPIEQLDVWSTIEAEQP